MTIFQIMLESVNYISPWVKSLSKQFLSNQQYLVQCLENPKQCEKSVKFPTLFWFFHSWLFTSKCWLCEHFNIYKTSTLHFSKFYGNYLVFHITCMVQKFQKSGFSNIKHKKWYWNKSILRNSLAHLVTVTYEIKRSSFWRWKHLFRVICALPEVIEGLFWLKNIWTIHYFPKHFEQFHGRAGATNYFLSVLTREELLLGKLIVISRLIWLFLQEFSIVHLVI